MDPDPCMDPVRRDAIAYRIIVRIGTAEDCHWMEEDTGVLTAMPLSRVSGITQEPSWDEAIDYARRFNELHAGEHREMQIVGWASEVRVDDLG